MCEITEGHDNSCDAPGGTRRAYLYSIKDSTGLTNYDAPIAYANGAVTSFALKAGKYAYPINFEPETAEVSCTSVGSTPSSSTANDHSVVLKLAGNTAAMIAQAQKLIKGRVGVIVELNDNTFELYHFENGGKVQRTRSPGTAMDEFNGSTLTITSRQVETELKISSTIVNSLLPPTP